MKNDISTKKVLSLRAKDVLAFSASHSQYHVQETSVVLSVQLSCPQLVIAIERGCNKLKKHLSCTTWSSCFSQGEEEKI